MGLGYKIYKVKNLLMLKLGFSHLICCKIPKVIEITIKKKLLELKSLNYYLLKQISTFLKILKLPDIYKGKGLYTLGEKKLIKQGKV
jgi:ribosomal protein L6P/L9E